MGRFDREQRRSAVFRSIVLTFFGSVCAEAQHLSDPVALVTLNVSDNVVSAGSGFLVSSQGWIITNRHVVISPDTEKPYGLAKVSFKSRHRQVPAEIKVCSPSKDVDLCLLKMSEADAAGFGISPPETSCRSLTRDDDLTSVGWPADQNSDYDIVSGKITGNLGPFGAYPTTIPLIHGMSGGPVYDKAGIIVGINLGGLKDDPTRTFILPYAYARDVLFKSTVSVCEDPPIKLDLTLNVLVSKAAVVHVKKLQDLGETNKTYSMPFSAEADYKIVESTFSPIHCNGCVILDLVVRDDRSSGSFSFSLSGSSGYIDGLIDLKQGRTLKQKLDTTMPAKAGWN